MSRKLSTVYGRDPLAVSADFHEDSTKRFTTCTVFVDWEGILLYGLGVAKRSTEDPYIQNVGDTLSFARALRDAADHLEAQACEVLDEMA